MPYHKTRTSMRKWVDENIYSYGIPVHTNQDANFESQLWRELPEYLQMKIRTTLYYLQSDGMVKRFNRTISLYGVVSDYGSG